MPHVTLPRLGTATAWRDAARGFLSNGIPPEQVTWGDSTTPAGLFDAPCPALPAGTVTVPKSFVSMADKVVWHSDPMRFARLYAFLWRLKDAPDLMADRGCAELAKLRMMEKNVRRCQHKMKAFVRFRDIGTTADGRRSFAAWFEPTHHTIEPTATFFTRRFADMDWRILTPDVSVFFENGNLRFDVDQPRPDLPEDASEGLWVTYFRNIFNPARLKVQAMQSEMPKKYWKNMPEAAAIPDLIANAPARARAMAEAAPTLPPIRAAAAQAQQAALTSVWEGTPETLHQEIASCTRCPLHHTATQAVVGEGPQDATLMIVGEQPGDLEDLQGRPFVGPAGQLFDDAAKRAGLDRSRAYVTNAVKHFKFIARGRRRIHQRPDSGEIEHCQWWLQAEIARTRPALIIALGATAAEALTGSGKGLTKRRGQIQEGLDGVPVLVTFHPAYLLRIPDAARRSDAMTWFEKDLRQAARITRENSQVPVL